MRHRKARLAGLTGTLILLAASVGALEYARCARAVSEGSSALNAGDYNGAAVACRRAEDLVTHSFLPAVFLAENYRVVIFNEARIAWETKRIPELNGVLQRVTARSPGMANDPEYHFWSGLVDYSRAVSEPEKQAATMELQRSAESFRLAVAGSGGGMWDAKYDYEMVARMIAGVRNKQEKPETGKRGGMNILREETDKEKNPQRVTAPGKKG